MIQKHISTIKTLQRAILLMALLFMNRTLWGWSVQELAYICPGQTDVTIEINQAWYNDFVWYNEAECQNQIGEGSKITIGESKKGGSIYVKRANDPKEEAQQVKIMGATPITISEITQGNQGILCKGGTVELSADIQGGAPTDGISYAWYKDNKHVGNGSSFSANALGNYTLEISSQGCTTSKSTVITQEKKITRVSGGDAVCSGGSVTIEVSGMDSYEWRGEDLKESKGNKNQITKAGNYTIVGESEEGGCKDSLTFTISQKEQLDVNIEGVTALCPGEENTELIASVTGSSSALTEFRWYDPDGLPISTEAFITVDKEGDYKVEATTGGCQGKTNKMIRRIKDVPPTNIIGDTAMTLCAGESKEITAEGDKLNTFVWRKADGEFIEKTEGTIKLKEGGSYMVTGYTKDGCVSDTVTFNMDVKDNPLLTFPVYHPCKGDTITVKAEYEEGITFQWLAPNDIPDKTNPEITITEEGVYTCMVSDPKTKCSTNSSVEINFPDYPVISAPDNITFCEGSSAELTVEVKNGEKESYRWIDSEGKILSAKNDKINVSQAGEYTFHAENEHGCASEKTIVVTSKEKPQFTITQFPQFLCNETDTVVLTAQSSEAKAFVWKKDNIKKSSENELRVNESGSYRLTVTGQNGCETDTTITVASKSQAKVTYTVDTICEGASGKIHLSADIACDYEWADGSTNDELEVSETGIYKVTATDQINHCSQSISISVDIQPKASFTVDQESLILCEGDSAVIFEENLWSNYFRWKHIEISSNKNQTYHIGEKGGDLAETKAFIIREEGNYDILAINKMGCASDTTHVTVTKAAKPSITWNAPDTFCYGDTLVIAPTVTGAEPIQYKWSTNRETESISITKAGHYALVVTDANKCQMEEEHEISIDKPNAEIIGEKEFCSDSTLSLTVQGDADKYFWNEETESKETYTTDESGTVTLRAVSKAGCGITLTYEVTERERPTLSADSVAYFCENSSTELSAKLDKAASKFIWDEKDESATLSVDQESQHSVVGYDKWGCPSAPITIRTEMTRTPIVKIEGKDFVCEDGEAIVLTAKVENKYDFNEWSNGEEADSITTQKGGRFVVIAHVGRCVSEPDTFDVEFIKKPQIKIIGESQFCTDSTIMLTAEGNATEYYWNDSQEEGTQYTLSKSDTVTLTGIDDHQCRSSVTKRIIRREKPVIHLDSVIYYCENSFIDLRADMDSTPSRFIWNGTEETTSDTYKADEEKSYTVIGYDRWNCPSEEVKTQVKMTHVPEVEIIGQDYVCQDGAPTPLTVQVEGMHDRLEWSTLETSDTILSRTGGQYTVTAFIGICASFPDTFDVEYKKIPELSIEEGEEAEFCDSLSITLHAGSPTAEKFRWEPGDVTSSTIEVDSMGIFTVYAEDQFGCVNHAQVKTIAIPGPRMEIIGDTSLCELGTTIITLDCPDCVSQTWNTGETSESITIYESGTYTIKGIDKRGCPNSASHHLRINQAPTLTIEGNREITGNDSTTLTAVATGEAPFRYYWTPTKEMSSSITVTSNDFDQRENYSVIVYDKNGCYNFTSTSVTKHSVKLNGKMDFCEGENSILTAIGDGITGYLWSTGDTTPSIMVSQAGLYSIVTFHSIGVSDTIRFEVIVHPNPEVKITGDLSLCRGDSTFLSVISDTEDIQWSTGSSQDSIIIRDKGIYSVKATSSFGCVNHDSVEIQLFEIPDVTISGPDSILEGKNIFLQAGGAFTYHWEKPDTIAESIEINDGGHYKVTGIDANNCKNSAVKDVRVIPVPHPLINDTIDGHTIACVDEKVMLVASGANYYRWDTGETNDTIYANESRIYTMIGCLNNGQCDSAHFSVELSPRPRMMSIEGEKHICPGEFTTFTAHTYEDSLISHFVWNTKETTQSIKVKDESTYTVKAISKYGCLSDSISTELIFYPTPTPTISGVYEICEGGSTTLHAQGGRSYLWPMTQENTEEITIREPGEAILRAWNEYGCAADTSVHIAYRGKPNIRIKGESSICEGDSAQLSVTGDQFLQNHYLWNTGDTTESIMVKTGGAYTVSLSNRAGCKAQDTLTFVVHPNPVIQIDGLNVVCADDSIRLSCRQISGNPITKHIWNNETKDSTLTVTSANIYTLQVVDLHSCVSNKAQHEVKVHTPNPIITAGDFDICNQQEDKAKINASSKGATFFMWFSPQGDTLSYGDPSLEALYAGTYQVVAIDSFGCAIHKDVSVKGHDAPNVRIKGAETPVCGPATATLRIEANPLYRTYTWGDGTHGTQIVCEESGEYGITVIDTFGCIGKDEAYLILNDIPQMGIDGNLGFCPNSSTEIKVVGADSYLWSTGTSNDITEIHEEGDYTVSGTDRYGCQKTITFHVGKYQLPDVSLVETPSKISRVNPEVKFIAFSDEDISNCAFVWSMGDGNEMEGKEFSYTFDLQQQRWFNVTMTVKTTEGCMDNKMVTLGIDLEIPNTITPNGDDINDVFMKGFDVEIFDRHGERVFHGDDGWDGHLKDKSVVADTYYYVLTDITGEVYRGYLTVRK